MAKNPSPQQPGGPGGAGGFLIFNLTGFRLKRSSGRSGAKAELPQVPRDARHGASSRRPAVAHVAQTSAASARQSTTISSQAEVDNNTAESPRVDTPNQHGMAPTQPREAPQRQLELQGMQGPQLGRQGNVPHSTVHRTEAQSPEASALARRVAGSRASDAAEGEGGRNALASACDSDPLQCGGGGQPAAGANHGS